MRKVIRKKVRHTGDGLRLAADLNAAVSLNTGEDGQHTRTVVRSSTNVTQGDESAPPSQDPSRPSPSDPPPAKESP